MTNADWRDQIRFAAEVGITTLIVQQVFLYNDYVGFTNATCNDYPGAAFYPSKIYPNPYDEFVHPGDKLEAIMSAADQYGVKIFLGVGIFSW